MQVRFPKKFFRRRMPQPGGIGPSGKPRWVEDSLAATATPGQPVGLGIKAVIAGNEAEIARTTARDAHLPEAAKPES